MKMYKKPDISNYNTEEVKQALSSIDKDLFPERFVELQARLIDLEKMESSERETSEKEPLSGTSIFLGRFGYLGMSIFLFYFMYDAFITGEIAGYRGRTVYLEDEPVYFYIRIAVYFVLGVICSWASIDYWFEEKGA